MPRRVWDRCLAVLLVAALAGCGTLNVGGGLAPEPQASGFKLHVLDDSFIEGASVQDVSLAIADRGSSVVASVNATGAKHLKALFFDLAYDAAQYRPVSCEATDALGPPSDLLSVGVLKEAGKVYSGQILANPQWRTGFSGTATLSRVTFTRGRADVARVVSRVPTNDEARTHLSWDNATHTLSWLYYNAGDFDQNGRVQIYDILQIAVHFKAATGGGPFDPTSMESVIDGDNNGEVNLADLIPFIKNFGNVVIGYNVYHSLDPADYPASNDAPSDPTKRFEGVPTSDLSYRLTSERRLVTYVVASPVANDYMWVRPTDGTKDGTPSVPLWTSVAQLLALVESPMPSGSGTAADPYIVAPSTDYRLELTDPTAGNAHIESDANTVWAVVPASRGTITAALDHATLSTGTEPLDFSVSATYNGNASIPAALYFQISATAPQLALVESPMPSGLGTASVPYIVGASIDYRLELTDPAAGNAHIEGDAGTVWTVTPVSGGTIATFADHATLSVDAAATDFNVSAMYNSKASGPTALYFHVSSGGGLEIYPDPADTNWSAVTGTGTVGNPYVWDHPADYNLTYNMAADDLAGPGGHPVDVTTLIWDAMPPFIAEWPALGTFRVNMYSGGSIFAETGDSPPTISNYVYIEVHDMP